MAENFHFVARNSLEWITECPHIDSPRKSPTFLFLGNDWYLHLKLIDCNQLIYGKMKKCFRISLSVHNVENKEQLNVEAKVTVYVKQCEGPILERSVKSGSICLKKSETETFSVVTFDATNLHRYFGHWTVHCIFSTDIQSELHINESETMYLSNFPALEGQHISTPDRIVMKAKLAASAPDGSLHGVENLVFDFFKRLLEQKSFSDVTLKCGIRTFSAHRIILAARSEVFAAMFRNKMAESKTGIIDIKDIEGDVLDVLLKYMYTGKIPDLSVGITTGLYMAANKYSIKSLKNECSKLMLGNLNKENCLDFLLLADAFSDNTFKDRLINFIAEILNLIDEAWMKFTEKYPQLAVSVYQRYALITKKV